MSTQSSDRKLPMKVLLGMPIANFGPTIQTLVQIYFLLYFYTNVLGISGAAAATIILVARCWDFINDPLMGIIVEKTHKPQGKCLFWMNRALPFVCIFFVLAYAAPNFSNGMKIAWALITYIGLGMCQTAFSIPLNSLRPKLTTDKVQRQKLNVYENIFSQAANIIIPAVTMPFFAYLQGFGPGTAFLKMAAVYAVVYFVLSFIGLRLLKGQEIEDDEEAVAETKIKSSEMLKALMTNKVAMLILLAQVIHMFFSSLGGSVMVYYCQYNLQNVNLMSITSTLSIITALPILFLVPLYKKFGNAGIAVMGNLFAVACLLVRLITHDGSDMIYIIFGTAQGFGVTLVACVMYQNLMDSIDYGEWKTGHKNTPVLMSAMGIGTKIGMAFGGTVVGYIVSAVHYDPNAATQSAKVLNAFFQLSVTAPLIMYAGMAIIFFVLMKIEKQLPQMRKEVEERKAAAGEQEAQEVTETPAAE